jgi:hypothetical protein
MGNTSNKISTFYYITREIGFLTFIVIFLNFCDKPAREARKNSTHNLNSDQ